MTGKIIVLGIVFILSASIGVFGEEDVYQNINDETVRENLQGAEQSFITAQEELEKIDFEAARKKLKDLDDQARKEFEEFKGVDFKAIKEEYTNMPPPKNVIVTEDNIQKTLEIKKKELKIADRYGMSALRPEGRKAYKKEVDAVIMQHGLTPEEYMVISLKVMAIAMDETMKEQEQAGEIEEVHTENNIPPDEIKIIKKYLPEFMKLIKK